MKFYSEMCEKLRKGEPFKFSRWGDGEWLCMCGETGQNRDGNTYFPELGAELVKIVESEPDYYMGIQYGVFYNEKYVKGRKFPSLREYMIEMMFKHPSVDWKMGDVLHLASEFGYLGEFIDALKNRNVWIFGAEYFKKLPYLHIKIPETNSYRYNDKLFTTILDVNPLSFIDPVILVAAAMNSNIIIDRLPDNVTAIDIGSVFDPYLGRSRASYQHNMKAEWLW
jgi:hypothetical protein